MSSQLSAHAITAHTAMTRISVSRCSTLPAHRGSASAEKCSTSFSTDIAILPSSIKGEPAQPVVRQNFPALFMRRPCRASGARADRAGLQAALDYVRDGEVLVVWKLDRLWRSLPHLIETVTALSNRGVGFRSLTEAIDTTTPGGRLIFHIFGALGQFERDLIQERTRAGLAAATVRGRKSGRKPVITGDKLKRARGMVGTGLTVREIATRLKVGKTALYEALRAEPD